MASSSRATAAPTPEGFAAAIDMGYDMVRDELLAKIGETIHRHAGDERRGAAIGGAAS